MHICEQARKTLVSHRSNIIDMINPKLLENALSYLHICLINWLELYRSGSVIYEHTEFRSTPWAHDNLPRIGTNHNQVIPRPKAGDLRVTRSSRSQWHPS